MKVTAAGTDKNQSVFLSAFSVNINVIRGYINLSSSNLLLCCVFHVSFTNFLADTSSLIKQDGKYFFVSNQVNLRTPSVITFWNIYKMQLVIVLQYIYCRLTRGTLY